MSAPKVVGTTRIAVTREDLSCPEWRELPAVYLSDHFAIHRPHDAPDPAWWSTGWSLSHRPSGHSVMHFDTLDQARREARILERSADWSPATNIGSAILPGCCARLSAIKQLRSRVVGWTYSSGMPPWGGHRYSEMNA